MKDAEVRAEVERVERLIAEVESDPASLQAVRALVNLYGEALRRIVASGGVDGAADDELVSHLLLIHDLHPLDVEARVEQALAEVRPYLQSHGGDVELLAIEDGLARVRLRGTCNGCASSTATLKHAIEEAVARAAPELDGVEAEGVAEPQPALVQIGSLQCPTELAAR